MTNIKDSKYKWIILALTFFFMISYAFSLQSLPPLFSHITEDIPLSDSHAGMLMGAYAIPGMILPIIIALMANKIDKKTIICAALVIMIIGLIGFSLSNSFSLLLFFRVLAGIGSTVVAVSSPILVTMFFDDTNMGIAMGVLNAAVPLGTVFTANVFAILGETVNWKVIILGVAVFIGVVLACTIILLKLPKNKETNLQKTTKDKDKSMLSVLNNNKLWGISIIWSLSNFASISYLTFAPQFYQSVGLSLQKSSFLSSYMMLIPAILSFPIGIVIDKYGRKKELFLLGNIILVISYVLIAKLSSMYTLTAILLGIGVTPIPVLVFAIIPDIVSPKQTGLALGIVTSLANLGMTLGPAALGILLENTNRNFSLGFLISALLSIVVIFILLKFKIIEE